MGSRKREGSAEQTREQWHPQGRWWVGVGVAAVVLGLGFGTVMLVDQTALFAALGAMGTVLALILGSFSLRHWGIRASHVIGNRWWLKLLQPVLLV
ncbi:MAG: hypothetical protein KDE53_40600, partial [Caldilineaceae bacterium]|nr:hypothetical protein [Caldilineaceae bacterium]